MGYDAEWDMRRYKRYSGFIKVLLMICGVWPNCHPIRNKILSFVAAFSTFYGTSTVLNFCVHHVTNVIILTKGMGLVITFSSCFLKKSSVALYGVTTLVETYQLILITIFSVHKNKFHGLYSEVIIMLLHREDLLHLNRSLSARFTSDLDNSTDRHLLLSRLTSICSFFYLHAAFSGLAIMMYTITPLLALRHGKYPRMYPSVLPFTYEPGGLVHWCLFGLELSGFFYLWVSVNGVDYLFGLYALQICGELRLLSDRFQALGTGDNYRTRLRDCVQRHHLLIRSKKRMESTFGLLAVWLAVSGALVLCSLVFQVTEAVKTVTSPIQMCLLVFYIIGKVLQVLTYAWYGNLVAEESKACLNSMYNAHWPESGDARLRNDILFVLMQKPLIVVAKGCMQLHLDLFSKIVNTSVSYFFLLQTLNEN